MRSKYADVPLPAPPSTGDLGSGKSSKVFPTVSVNPRGSPAAGADLRSKYADVLMAAHASKC